MNKTRYAFAILVTGAVIFQAAGGLDGRGAAQAQEAAEPSSKPAMEGKADFIGAETCLSCHSDKETFRKNVHARAWPKAKDIEFERSCETCHGPGSLHADAAGDKQDPGFWTLKNPNKLKAVEANRTCLECHQGGDRMHWMGSVHEAKNVSCNSCHSMHDHAANRGRAPLLAKANSVEVCYQCHAEKKSQVRKSAHMPIVEGKMGCTACHNPHGSLAEKLVNKASVVETCYECHKEKRGPFLWEHLPVRENCLNCHNPHGSHNDSMLVTKVPLLCQRCHIATRHPSDLYSLGAAEADNNRLFNRGCANCHTQIHGSNHPSGKALLR